MRSLQAYFVLKLSGLKILCVKLFLIYLKDILDTAGQEEYR